jgi:hypothetical protein
VRIPGHLRNVHTRPRVREFVVGVGAALAVLTIHQLLLPRLRRPRPLGPPQPAVLSRVIPEVDASGTPAEALKRVGRAAMVTIVVRPEGFDPDEPRSPGIFGDENSKRIPPPKLDLRLRNVTLGQALGIIRELNPYRFEVSDAGADTIALRFRNGDEAPVVRMHDLGRLDGEAARFSAEFSGTAFGPAVTAAAAAANGGPAAKESRTRSWSAAQLWRVLEEQQSGPSSEFDNRRVGDLWFFRARAAFHEEMDAFLAVLEDPEARANDGGAAAGAPGAAADQGGGR